MVFKDKLIIDKLVPGKCFGARTLLPYASRFDGESEKAKRIRANIVPPSSFRERERSEFRKTLTNLYNKVAKRGDCSLFSVLAYSGEVEIYVIKKEQLDIIPDYL